MARVQHREELLPAPGWMPPPRVEDRGHNVLGRLIRGPPGPARALLQPRGPLAQVAVDPFVSGLARDPVERAQLGERPHVPQVIGDELRPLVHG